MRIRTIAFFFTALFCLGLTACLEVFFAKKAKGRNPIELAGDYYIHAYADTRNEVHGLLEFEHLGNSNYRISLEGEKIFEGEIVARGQDYFVNHADSSREGYWHIGSFRLLGDSAYNLVSAIAEVAYQEEALEVEKYFKHYELTVDEEEDSTYVVKNRRREVYKAYAALNDAAIAEGAGVYLQKLSSPEPVVEAGPAERLSPSLQIGPNPFVDHINLSLPTAVQSRLTLFSIDGQSLQQTQFEGNTYDWSLPNLAAGIYILRWENLANGQSESFRIVKQ
ncbi:MAG: T9SS type A sorting domain-containing protein [Bacteroidota bacterium]